jgi:hypothetical protein
VNARDYDLDLELEAPQPLQLKKSWCSIPCLHESGNLLNTSSWSPNVSARLC